MLTPIKITGLVHRGEEDSINASFDSIEKIINDWKPKITEQICDIIAYYGPLKKDQKITVKRKPFETTPIFAARGAAYVYVGDLEISGVFTSKWDSGKDTNGVPEKITIFQYYPAQKEEKNDNNRR